MQSTHLHFSFSDTLRQKWTQAKEKCLFCPNPPNPTPPRTAGPVRWRKLLSMNQSFFVLACAMHWLVPFNSFLKHHWLILPLSSDVVLLPWFPRATVCIVAPSVQNSSLCSHWHYSPKPLPLHVTETLLKEFTERNFKNINRGNNRERYWSLFTTILWHYTRAVYDPVIRQLL